MTVYGLRALASAIGLLGGLAAMGARADEPPPPNLKEPVDYVSWINKQYGDVRDNAANGYKRAVDAFVDDEAVGKDLKDKPFREWGESDKTAAKAWIEKNRAALDAFLAATEQGGCYFELAPAGSPMLEVTLPELGGLRKIARLVHYEGLFSASAGEMETATRNAVALLRASAHLQTQPFVISYLVGISLEASGQDLLAQIPVLAAEKADCAALLKRVRTANPPIRRPTRQFEVERLTFLDCAQRYALDTDGDGKIDRIAAAPVIDAQNGFALAAPKTFEEMLADAKPLYDRLVALASESPATVKAAGEKIVADARAGGASLQAVLLPNLGRVVELHHRAVAVRNGTRLLLCVHAFKQKNGRWPNDLKEALSGESAAILKDPFSGKDFVYKLTGGQPLLYSVGHDGKDDGGKRAADGNQFSESEACDAVFWPPPN